MIQRLDVKIVLIVLVTGLVPLGVSIYLVAQAVHASLGLGVNDQIAGRMMRGIESQRRLVAEIKRVHQLRFEHIADSAALAEAVASPEEGRVREVLDELARADPYILSVKLSGPEDRSVEVSVATDPGAGPLRTMTKSEEVSLGPYTSLEVVFGVDASILSEFEEAGRDMATYRALVDAPPAYLNRRFILVYLALLGGLVVVSVSAGILWSRKLAGRIHRLGAATSRVASGDLSVRVEPGARDEVGNLVESFNAMVGELSVSRARIEYLQKISAWQEMARRLAHEIKNPLTPIQLAVQQLEEKYDGSDAEFARLLEQSAEIVGEEVATLRRLTTDFSSFARLPQVEPEQVDLGEFLEECETSLAHIGEGEGVSMVWDVPTERISLLVDRMMMKRVLDNLVRNAAEALSKSGVVDPRIEIKAFWRDRRRAEVEIRVSDNGPGIPADHRPSIFDPYFTTKAEGTGLGLAISKKIVLEHGGRIWVDGGAGQGACFAMAIPAPGAAERG